MNDTALGFDHYRAGFSVGARTSNGRSRLRFLSVILSVTVIDALVCQGAALLSIYIFWHGFPLPSVPTLLLVTTMATLLSLLGNDAYRRSTLVAPSPPIWPLARAVLQIAGILAIAAFVTGFFGLGQLVHVSVQQKPFCGWLLAFSAFTLCGIVGARILLAATHRRLLALPRVVVVGTNDASGRLIEQLRRHKFGELNVIGRVVTDETGSDAGPGSLERLQRMVSCRELDEVLVASTITSPNDNVPVQLAGRVGSGSITLSVAADLRTRRPSEELPVVGLASPPISGAAGATKRIFDFATAAFLGAVGAPAMLLIALAIKIDSPGPVFFRQVRRGLNNEVFEILKFRTMHVQFADADASVQTRRNDQRVTRIGAVLRHHSIDEVPQLINVLRGDMSLVGPRPHALGTAVNGEPLHSIVPGYAGRHQVRPGITGWAQVNGWRGELDSSEKAIQRVKHDLEYIESWSLLLDLKILARTLRCVVLGEGAY